MGELVSFGRHRGAYDPTSDHLARLMPGPGPRHVKALRRGTVLTTAELRDLTHNRRNPLAEHTLATRGSE